MRRMIGQAFNQEKAMKSGRAGLQAAVEHGDIPVMYPLQDVIATVGITAALANNWSQRYPGVALEHSGRGKGRRRMVDAELVIRLRLMAVLTNIGASPEDALGIAQAVLQEIARTKRHSAFLISYYPDGKAVALPEHKTPRPGAEATLRLDVRQIIARVRERLDTLEAARNTDA
jgi:hypothetical protein